MTDISREAVEREVAGLRFLHKSTCIENRLPPKDCTTSHSRAADMILALRAALDAAEADKARAVEVEREACAGLAMQWVEGDCTCPRCLDATHIAAAIRARGAKP